MRAMTTRAISPCVDARADVFARLIKDVRACFACSAMAHCHVLSDANGALDAWVLFVAEAVGRRGGATTGVPLTRDESGKRFADFLALAGLRREDVFVTNAVLCNPLDTAGRNRTPTAAEAHRCRAFLARTLEIVPAPVVVALGRVALESLRAIWPHDADLTLDTARGVEWHGRTLVPMYHTSRQSTLHRPQGLQDDDWRRMGAIARELGQRAGRAAWHESATIADGLCSGGRASLR